MPLRTGMRLSEQYTLVWKNIDFERCEINLDRTKNGSPRMIPMIRLSPAYDINPSVDRNELSLAIDETETTCDVSVAMNAHKSYGISAAQAEAALKSIDAAVATWRAEATRLGIPRAEQNIMVTAFE